MRTDEWDLRSMLQKKKKKKKKIYNFPANSGLIRRLVPHGRAS